MFDEKSFFGPGRSQLNVLGDVLESCSIDPLTGFFVMVVVIGIQAI